MRKSDRETLLQCANIIIEQAAALKYWENMHESGYIGNIRSLKQFELLANQSQPHLDAIVGQVQHPLTDKAAFDTLRKFLEAVAE